MERARRREILVVEDEVRIAEVLGTQLDLAGYAVHAEASGGAALRYAAEHQPDLVILDVRLPDMSGLDVCKDLRKRYHSWVVPVLMLTAMDQPIDEIRGFAHGSDAYLTKPFDLDEVLHTVASLLGEETGAS